eukprot:UN07952
MQRLILKTKITSAKLQAPGPSFDGNKDNFLKGCKW